MRFFLEIRTQRIFNNSTKLKQKLGSNSVLNQPIAVSSVLSSASKVHVQRPESRVQSPRFRVQHSETSVHSAVSSVQRTVSSTCVQSPGIPYVDIIGIIGHKIDKNSIIIDFSVSKAPTEEQAFLYLTS